MSRLSRRFPPALVLIIGLAGTFAVGARDQGKSKEPSEPFYRKYLVAGDPLDERILAMERRIAAEPDSARLRNDFGNLLAERRFPEQAREQYEKALELDRSEFRAAYNLGLLYEAEGKTARAIFAYRKSIARKPGFPHSRFRLGRLYEKRGWEKLAVGEYARALRLDPAMRDPRVNPLVIDVRLLDRASLENYPRDLASASLSSALAYSTSEPGGRPPIDQRLWSEEVQDPSSPEPVADAPVPGPVQMPQTQPPRVAAPAQPMPPAEYEITPPEGELAPAPGDERPAYLGGARPTPTP